MTEPGNKSGLPESLAILGVIILALVIGVIFYIMGRHGGIEPGNDKTVATSKAPSEESGKITKSEQSSQEIAELKSQIVKMEAKQHLTMGMTYARNKDYDNSITEFTLAINKDPGYAMAYSDRAIAYMQQDKFNKAKEDLQHAVELSPSDPVIRYNYAAFYSLQEQLDLALDSLDKALELGFNDYDSIRNDPDLKNIRSHPEYKKVLEKHKVFIK